MKYWRKFVIVLIALALVVVVFYAGGLFGYMQGYGDGSNAPVNAVSKVSVLKCIRKGDTPMAIRLLETELDGNIVYHWAQKDLDKSYFDVFGFKKHDKLFMGRISAYRRATPYNGSDNQINDVVKTVLHQYSTNKLTAKTQQGR